MGGHGKCAGVVGGSVLLGHLHGASSGPAMPVLMQGSGIGLVTEDKLAVLVLSIICICIFKIEFKAR